MESRLRNALRELSKRYVYRKFAIDRTARNTKFMRARVKSKKKGFNRFHALRIYKREQLNDTNTYNSYTFDVRVSEFACFLCLFGVHVRYICTTLQMMRKALCLSLYDEGHFKVGFTLLSYIFYTKKQTLTSNIFSLSLSQYHISCTHKQIKTFAQKMMKTSDNRVDVKLNKAVWSKGIRNVPKRIRVQISRRRNDNEDAEEEMYSYITVVDDVNKGDFKGLGTKVITE